MKVSDQVLRLSTFDKEGMALFKLGRMPDGINKLVDAVQPYKEKSPLDCTPEEALLVAIIHVRLLTVFGKNNDDQAKMKLIHFMAGYAERGGISFYSESGQRWFESIAHETAATWGKTISKTPDELFTDAFEEACKLGANADKDEPEITRQAIALLTGYERGLALNYMRPNFRLEIMRTEPAELRKLGMKAWLDKYSRKFAQSDAAFKPVARILWDTSTGANGLLQMMNQWAWIQNRAYLINCVNQNIPTTKLASFVRDDILILGGAKWLQRSSP